MPIEKEVLTTGEVAKICNVAPRTVSKWFDSGSLKGYRIPGSRDRRIPASELVKFMKAHGIPLESFNSGRTRVLVVDGDKDVADTLQRVLTEQTSYEVRTATNGFQAGMECEKFKPHVLLLDLHLGESGGAGTSAAKGVADLVRSSDNLQFTRIIAMSGKLTEGQTQTLRSQGFDTFLKKPFQIRQVVESIEQATALAA
ncbi:MAG: response regulator [Planctomycetota bacterium]|nr:response regulator [Planctomycetota bacterium]